MGDNYWTGAYKTCLVITLTNKQWQGLFIKVTVYNLISLVVEEKFNICHTVKRGDLVNSTQWISSSLTITFYCHHTEAAHGVRAKANIPLTNSKCD